jgi:hypothetical protein
MRVTAQTDIFYHRQKKENRMQEKNKVSSRLIAIVKKCEKEVADLHYSLAGDKAEAELKHDAALMLAFNAREAAAYDAAKAAAAASVDKEIDALKAAAAEKVLAPLSEDASRHLDALSKRESISPAEAEAFYGRYGGNYQFAAGLASILRKTAAADAEGDAVLHGERDYRGSELEEYYAALEKCRDNTKAEIGYIKPGESRSGASMAFALALGARNAFTSSYTKADLFQLALERYSSV